MTIDHLGKGATWSVPGDIIAMRETVSIRLRIGTMATLFAIRHTNRYRLICHEFADQRLVVHTDLCEDVLRCLAARVVTEECTMTPVSTILHPTDFSKNSDDAFRLACALARDYGAKLILLHVRPRIVPGGVMTSPAESQELEEEMRRKLNAIRPDDPTIAVQHYVLVGSEADEIARLAHEKACDLIVMGTHGRTGLGRLLMGSVAEKVLRKATCPVVTLKRPSFDERP